ncbi:hypothetical protein QT384_10215 [Arcobacter cryaerophilus gv. pseudocryaerophilus]|uniref:Uncharacterized protein n=3 Tax=Arcobacteraceae TaxID=2808963 RepID=A0AA96DUJ1_9BACT|nr:hypothetical protein RMP68_02420 [Arcobacter sp. AZ-2023]WNL36046.1 hypothetical protein RMQ66_10215 [Arcobacter sp. AZ-2023]WPD11762.1 hypothetical protein QT384_10215 [Arcobacter sp. DSM 115960]
MIRIVNNINDFVKKDENIETIIQTTQETWQKDRTEQSKKQDTELGKLAENIVEGYIKTNMKDITYLSYDDFRKDEFKKHAPFDGLIYNKKTTVKIQYVINAINKEVGDNQYGKISDGLKNKLHQNKIYIVEVKSTRVSEQRHFVANKIDLDKLLEDDFLEYPKYLRVDKFDTMNNMEAYIDFCKKYRSFKCNDNLDCLNKIKNEELSNMRHVYIRVYIDIKNSIGYIIGYITNAEFIKNLNLKKMVQPGKSEKALYLSCSLRNASDLEELNNI